MNCGKCGQRIEGDSRFCRHCGAPLTEQAEPERDGSSALGAAAPAAAGSDKGVDIYRDPKQEQDVWRGRPSGRAYYGTWALWVSAGVVLLGAAWKWQPADSSVILKLASAVVLLSGLYLLGRAAWLVFGTHYHLTTQRLFVRRGILSRTTDQTELVRIDDVRLRQGILDRMLDIGNVELIGTDSTDQNLVLRSIRTPHDVMELVRRHVRGSRSKGTLFVEQV